MLGAFGPPFFVFYVLFAMLFVVGIVDTGSETFAVSVHYSISRLVWCSVSAINGARITECLWPIWRFFRADRARSM